MRRLVVPRLAVSMLVAAFAVSATAGGAAAYPVTVVSKCRGDYKRLCPQYKKLGDELEACMRSNYRAISNVCINSLVDAGLAPSIARRR